MTDVDDQIGDIRDFLERQESRAAMNRNNAGTRDCQFADVRGEHHRAAEFPNNRLAGDCMRTCQTSISDAGSPLQLTVQVVVEY